METEGKKILVDYLTDVADTFRNITGETGLIDARGFSTEIEKVAGGSGSKNSYQRGSIEEMNAITDASDGDKCLILKETESNIVEDGKVRRLSFPQQVIMITPITQFYTAQLEAPAETYGDVCLSNSDFDFMLMDNSSNEVSVRYSSADGVTYTRDIFYINGNFTKVDDNTVDFGFNISISNTNEYIGAFLLGIVTTYGGIYTKHGNTWDVQGLGYKIIPDNVESSVKYYNDGEQEGKLGKIETIQDVTRLNNFMSKYGIGFVYPEVMRMPFYRYDGEKIPIFEINPDTSSVVDMSWMLYDCPNLKSIPLLDTSNVTNMQHVFEDCPKLLSIPALNTSKSTNFNGTFINCASLETIPLLDTSKATNTANMFDGCTSLKTIPALETGNNLYTYAMFRGCTSLTSVPALNTAKVENTAYMLSGCSSLVDLGGFLNLGEGYKTTEKANTIIYTLNLSDSPLLTHDSLMNVINNLYNIKSKGVKTQTLQLGDTNKAKLTTEEIAIATNKGWNVI